MKFAYWFTKQEGESLTGNRWYYGLAHYDFERNSYLIMLIPFNIIYAALYWLLMAIRFRFPNQVRNYERKFYSKGFNRGYADGKAAVPQIYSIGSEGQSAYEQGYYDGKIRGATDAFAQMESLLDKHAPPL